MPGILPAFRINSALKVGLKRLASVRQLFSNHIKYSQSFIFATVGWQPGVTDTKSYKMLLFISPVAGAALMLLSFPPFELYITPFIALVPLIFLIDRSSSTARAATGTFMFGMAFWLGLLYWITLYTRAGYLVSALILSGVMTVSAILIRRLRSKIGVPLTLSIPLVWTAASYVHAHGDIAFTWGQLPYTLSYMPIWLQMASVTGPYGVTMWLAVVNVVIYGLIFSKRNRLQLLSFQLLKETFRLLISM